MKTIDGTLLNKLGSAFPMQYVLVKHIIKVIRVNNVNSPRHTIPYSLSSWLERCHTCDDVDNRTSGMYILNLHPIAVLDHCGMMKNLLSYLQVALPLKCKHLLKQY